MSRRSRLRRGNDGSKRTWAHELDKIQATKPKKEPGKKVGNDFKSVPLIWGRYRRTGSKPGGKGFHECADYEEGHWEKELGRGGGGGNALRGGPLSRATS